MDNPFEAPKAPTAELWGGEPVLAQPMTRVFAKVVDYLIYGLVSGVPVGMLTVLSDTADEQALAEQAVVPMAMLLGVVGITNAVMITTRGQTLGKRLLGVRVVKESGEPCGFWTGVVVREMAYTFLAALVGEALSLLTCGALRLSGLVGLVNVAVLFSNGHRALHDRLAKTKVIRA